MGNVQMLGIIELNLACFASMVEFIRLKFRCRRQGREF